MTQKPEIIRDAVRKDYARVAKRESSGCCSSTGCCSGEKQILPSDSLKLGYTADDLTAVPDGADLGLGCGNP